MKHFFKFILATTFSMILLLSMAVSQVNAKNDIALSAVEEVRILGVDIPEEVLSLDNCEMILDDLLRMAKEGTQPVYNYQVMQILFNDIFNAINRNSSLTENHENLFALYTLVNSSRYGVLGDPSWNLSYLEYNCYAYALSMPGLGSINPGEISGRTFSLNMTISAMADSVIADLDVLGFSAYKTTTKPTVFTGAQLVVSIRKASSDFHFMKGITPNVWRHKPGETLPLQWNYSTPNYKIWNNEYSVYNLDYAGTISYDSTIYYIIGFLQIMSPIGY
jgi:hypothetical protein